MIFRVPDGWVERRRSTARVAAPLFFLLGMGVLALALTPRVNWSVEKERHAAIIVAAVVVVGLLLGSLAGRFSFRAKMRRWESFSVELKDQELIRQMDGQETRIQRANVRSIREFPRRGVVVTDALGWQIFVPRIVENYPAFREGILKWGSAR